MFCGSWVASSPATGATISFCVPAGEAMRRRSEFTMLLVETSNMHEVRWARDPGDPRKMVQETIVSPYSQFFKLPH